MFEPGFRLILDKDAFGQDKVVCLGSQMIEIINLLKGVLEPHVWYAADIDAFGKGMSDHNLSFQGIKKIGTDDSLVSICTEIDQFLSGIFIAIREKSCSQSFIEENISTEDEPFRLLKIDGVLLEIRAFDTSFFEIFSENESLIKELSVKFNEAYTLKAAKK